MIAAGSVASSSAKYALTAAGVAVADWTIGGVDLVVAGGIVIGLIAGAVGKSARHVEHEAGWSAIKKDLLVSMMSGMANFIIAAIVVAGGTMIVPGFPFYAAMGVGLFFGYKGQDGMRWFNAKFFNDPPADPPRYAGPPSADTPIAMTRLAEKIDEPER
ncbi:hypothetical protein [Croceicoccus sp. YJ47]|uniref:hypothetical protein n=1 Tax=Croceicoccus sp. YJ47 TaxID=2798724 RepID=UPI001923BCB7|nr:hypothetical protein [Croceicoccus sp. YJ47]QQN73884.1 hypothetical protein JD971_14210 [Croceicoccus sp. YJ47]